MIRRVILIAVAALLAVPSAAAWADDDSCTRNHYILWTGPDHARAQCVPVVDDDAVVQVAKGVAMAVEYYHVATACRFNRAR
jgi:hypothetical protein